MIIIFCHDPLQTWKLLFVAALPSPLGGWPSEARSAEVFPDGWNHVMVLQRHPLSQKSEIFDSSPRRGAKGRCTVKQQFMCFSTAERAVYASN